jgi:hypothetical protein
MKEPDTPMKMQFIPIHAGEEDDTIENYYSFISVLQIQYQLMYAGNLFILHIEYCRKCSHLCSSIILKFNYSNSMRYADNTSSEDEPLIA